MLVKILFWLIGVDIMKTDFFFMSEALKEAKLAAMAGEMPVGAVVVCDGEIIARAHNQVEQLCDPTAHAEMLALTSATNFFNSKYLLDCTLYVTLEPCIMCSGAIYWSKVKRLVFGAENPQRGYQIFSPLTLHSCTKVKKHILEKESNELLIGFFTKLRNTIL